MTVAFRACLFTAAWVAAFAVLPKLKDDTTCLTNEKRWPGKNFFFLPPLFQGGCVLVTLAW